MGEFHQGEFQGASAEFLAGSRGTKEWFAEASDGFQDSWDI